MDGLLISATESNALFTELVEDSPGQGFQSEARADILRFAAAILLVFAASTSTVSSLDAPQPHPASLVTEQGRVPQILVAFTNGEAMVAGIALVP